jgi:CBS-domain-containing membrane protein
MKISDCMKRKVISSKPETSVYEAIQLLVKYHIGSLPIVNEKCQLIGLARIRDFVTLAMPDFVHLMENLDFVHDFGALEDEIPNKELLNMPVSKIMHDPICVESTAGLMRATALLQEHKLHDLPVVDENMRLMGIASYVDIGVAILSGWNTEKKE